MTTAAAAGILARASARSWICECYRWDANKPPQTCSLRTSCGRCAHLCGRRRCGRRRARHARVAGPTRLRRVGSASRARAAASLSRSPSASKRAASKPAVYPSRTSGLLVPPPGTRSTSERVKSESADNPFHTFPASPAALIARAFSESVAASVARLALPQRSPSPLSVPCSMVAPPRTAASMLATASPQSSWQCTPSCASEKLPSAESSSRRTSPLAAST